MVHFFELAYEWIITEIWERHGPVVGVVAGLAVFATMVGIAALVISYLPQTSAY